MKQGHGLRTYKKYSSEISLPFLGLKGLYLRDLIFYREGEGGEPRLGGHHIYRLCLSYQITPYNCNSYQRAFFQKKRVHIWYL